MSSDILAAIIDRAILLVPLLALALLIGEPLAKLIQLPRLRAACARRIARLNSQLNRSQRSTATRLYRGMVALFLILIVPTAVGIALTGNTLASLLLIPLLGEAISPYRFLRIWREAKRGTLTLQSDDPAYLFADQHGKLRETMVRLGERFTVALVGASLYYAVADMAGLFIYLTLAATAAIYSPINPANRAFGWAATGLFALINAVPRFVACLLLWLGSLCTPGTRPFRALAHMAAPFYGWFAILLGLSFGGQLPRPSGIATLPWIGTGTPQPLARDMGRAVLLVGLGSLLWIMLLGSSIYLLPIIK